MFGGYFGGFKMTIHDIDEKYLKNTNESLRSRISSLLLMSDKPRNLLSEVLNVSRSTIYDELYRMKQDKLVRSYEVRGKRGRSKVMWKLIDTNDKKQICVYCTKMYTNIRKHEFHCKHNPCKKIYIKNGQKYHSVAFYISEKSFNYITKNGRTKSEEVLKAINEKIERDKTLNRFDSSDVKVKTLSISKELKYKLLEWKENEIISNISSFIRSALLEKELLLRIKNGELDG